MSNTTPQAVKVQLEIVSEDPKNLDPAMISEVAREVIDVLRHDGYHIIPVYTGTRGGTLFEVVQQLTQNIQTNKEFLTVLFGLAASVAQYLLKEHERRLEKKKSLASAESRSTKVTITVDGASIAVETPDVDSAAKLVDLFQTTHPDAATRATLQSTVKVTGSVAERKSRRRR